MMIIHFTKIAHFDKGLAPPPPNKFPVLPPGGGPLPGGPPCPGGGPLYCGCPGGGPLYPPGGPP